MKAKRGMTLLEVLVALAIFATAAIATIRSVSQHINTLNYLEEKTFAALVADNQMAKVMLAGSKPIGQLMEGDLLAEIKSCERRFFEGIRAGGTKVTVKLADA